jgi:hypothetical protein
MQDHQVRILCALRDKILEQMLDADDILTRQTWSSEYAVTRQKAMDRARRRMERLGSGSPELFNLAGSSGSLSTSGRRRRNECRAE